MTHHLPTAMPRLRVYYHNAAAAHVLNLHFAPGTDAVTAASNGQAVCNQLKTLLYSGNEGFDRADFIPAGTNIGNPVTFAPIAGAGAGSGNAANGLMCLTFPGRTVAGTRTRLFLFITRYGLEANMRIEGSEDGAVQTIITWLNTTANPIVALDGLGAVWKNYANLTPHRHWVRMRRKLAG